MVDSNDTMPDEWLNGKAEFAAFTIYCDAAPKGCSTAVTKTFKSKVNDDPS